MSKSNLHSRLENKKTKVTRWTKATRKNGICELKIADFHIFRSSMSMCTHTHLNTRANRHTNMWI